MSPTEISKTGKMDTLFNYLQRINNFLLSCRNWVSFALLVLPQTCFPKYRQVILGLGAMQKFLT